MVLHANPFKLEKETLKPRPHTISTEYQAGDCFSTLAVSHWFLSNHSLLNLTFLMFMSNGRWAPIRFIYHLSSFDNDWNGFASRSLTWFMTMTACQAC
jgi:hypothetical protein